MNRRIRAAGFAAAFFGIAAFICLSRTSFGHNRSESAENGTAAGESLKILTIGTADSGGTMYPVGNAIAQVISGRNQNIKINISASNGSRNNVEGLRDRQIDMGLVSGDVAYCAYYGMEEFSSRPQENLRAIAAIYLSVSNWIAPDSADISYVHQLEGKRAAVGPQGSTTELAARTALGILGLNDSNTSLKNYGLGSGGTEVLKGNLDALHGFAGIPIAGLTELAEEIPSHLLKYTDEELRRIVTMNPFYCKTIIPAGAYPGQDGDVETFGVKCLLCVDADMEEELAYSITRALAESVPELTAGHEAMRSMEQIEFLCLDLPIPLHPGAEQYYKESGAFNTVN